MSESASNIIIPDMVQAKTIELVTRVQRDVDVLKFKMEAVIYQLSQLDKDLQKLIDKEI